MTPADSKAIKWAINKYWLSKTDDELAHSLHTTSDVITKMRLELNLKGTESLKEYARRYLLEMTEPEKKKFMLGLPSELVWRMSEGSPHTTEDMTIKHILPTPIMSLDAPMKVKELSTGTHLHNDDDDVTLK